MPKRRTLGCSFPVLIVVSVILFALVIIGVIGGPIGQGLFGKSILPSWLIIPEPEPQLPAEAVFTIGTFPITNSIIATWLTMLVLVGLAWAATRRMKLVPSGVQNFFEFVLNTLYRFCENVAGEQNGRRFFPLIATIFLFVLVNAWLSLLPNRAWGTRIASLKQDRTCICR